MPLTGSIVLRVKSRHPLAFNPQTPRLDLGPRDIRERSTIRSVPRDSSRSPITASWPSTQLEVSQAPFQRSSDKTRPLTSLAPVARQGAP
jgi:hypothetical protein